MPTATAATTRAAHGFVLTASIQADSADHADEEEEEEDAVTSLFRATTESCHHVDAVAATTEIDHATRVRRPRSGSEGLDFLAAWAERERHALLLQHAEHHSMDDAAAAAATVAMPPPFARRPRSVSNPEDMMLMQTTTSLSSSSSCDSTWDARSLGTRNHYSRRGLVLPETILEEELAAVTTQVSATTTLLQNARARLLEDISEECTGEKGELVLPHALTKYKEVR